MFNSFVNKVSKFFVEKYNPIYHLLCNRNLPIVIIVSLVSNHIIKISHSFYDWIESQPVYEYTRKRLTLTLLIQMFHLFSLKLLGIINISRQLVHTIIFITVASHQHCWITIIAPHHHCFHEIKCCINIFSTRLSHISSLHLITIHENHHRCFPYFFHHRCFIIIIIKKKTLVSNQHGCKIVDSLNHFFHYHYLNIIVFDNCSASSLTYFASHQLLRLAFNNQLS